MRSPPLIGKTGVHTAPLGRATSARPPACLGSSSSSWGLAALVSDLRPKDAQPGSGGSGHQLRRFSGRPWAAAGGAHLFAAQLGAPVRDLGMWPRTARRDLQAKDRA